MAYTLTITGAGSIQYCHVTIGGTKYYDPTTLTVEAGTEITCGARGSAQNTPIVENGVAVGTGSVGTTYTFAIVADTEIELYSNGAYDNAINITYKIAPADPMAPHDGHNTNIDSTACQLESGTVLLGGVAYEIEMGMTLAGGVVYEIPFGSKSVVVTISGTTHIDNAYITIGGTKIRDTGTNEYDKPLEITVHVGYSNSGAKNSPWIKLNGTQVLSGKGDYTFTTKADTVEIVFAAGKYMSSNNAYYTADITEL